MLGDADRDVLVLPGQDPLPRVDDGDLGAESGEHPGELEPDVPAADDDQPLGEGIGVLERRRVVHPGRVGAGDRRGGRHGAGVDDDRPRDDAHPVLPLRHLDGVRIDERGRPHDDHRVGGLLDEFAVPRVELPDERIAGLDGGGEPVGGRGILGPHGRLVDERLRRNAGDVDARAADHRLRLLDERDPGAAAPASPKSSCNYSTYWSATSVTSEGFAANVYLAILDACNNAGGPNVTVEAYSPTTGRTYAMSCSGTTVVTCRGGDNAVVKIS